MIKLRNFSFRKLLAFMVMLSMVFSFLAVTTAPVLAADDDDEIAITIIGNGVENKVELTMAQLKALPQETHDYTGYNFFPSLQFFKDTTGVKLQTILNQAVLKENATMIKIKSANSSYNYYTKRDLLDLPRYYFPVGEDGSDCLDWPPKDRGSEEGKIPVPTMIAFINGGKLIYGQQTPLEPTCCKGEQIEGLLPGCTIEVTTDTPEKWNMPDAFPDSTTVVPGTEVKLQYGNGSIWHTKMYYTLDGSEPTVKSNIYNISYPIFQPWLNKAIPIDKDITIKARAIGLGKLDSDVVTYDYKLGTLACTVQGAGIKADYAVETLKSMTPVQETYQCIESEQSISLNAKGVMLNTLLLDELGVASNWKVQFVSASGEEYDGGTVQDLKDQQCMLAYEVNGDEISDVSGDETVKIQILRKRDGDNVSAERLKHVNFIKLINVDDKIRIDKVRLLDCNGQSISSVAPGGGYCIEVDTVNAVGTAKDALLIIQLRCGQNVDRTSGGKVVAYIAAQMLIGADGAKSRAEFTLPCDLIGKAYVDVFVWDNIHNKNPLGSENQTLSFNIK